MLRFRAWVFLKIHKIGNIGIIDNFILQYIFCFLLNLFHIMLVNSKLDVSVAMRGLHVKLIQLIPVFLKFQKVGNKVEVR